jgi:pimeloyl-ACP methyl ester carboxylesterase
MAVVTVVTVGTTGGPGAGTATATTSPGGSGPATLRVGSQTLTRCGGDPTAYCGTLSVPLDYADPTADRISIAYRWYPASDPGGAPTGTVLPVEGGPGYPSIESVKGYYTVMYGALLDHWNLLAVDQRGTGRSTPLDCPALQNFVGQASGRAYRAVAASCADALDHRWKTPSGRWVHASDLFTSAPAAADMAAVIRALEVPQVDLYGDSYGSFFAQVFANRYPGLVHSMILDSTYETQGLDPWYRSTIDDMPADFDAACARSPACAQAETESSWSRIEALAASLRRHPASGTVPGPDGSLEPVTMGVVGLVDLLNDAAGDPEIYRGVDASARALLDDHDPAPLLRLFAQRLGFDEDYFGTPAASYSDEMYLATSCLDYPQLFDMSAPTPVRLAELRSAEAALPTSTFAPFTIDEWLDQNQNTEAYTVCAGWPSPTEAEPPTTGTTPLVPASLPVLILGGELDTWTPPTDVGRVVAELGGHSRFIELANSTHVVGEGDTACGSELVQEFVAAPDDLDSMDASCAPSVPPIDTVGSYPESVGAETPLAPDPGNAASTGKLRLAAAAVATAGDALARRQAVDVTHDNGLHGGSVHARGSVLVLSGDQLVPGVAVSGRLVASTAVVEASLTVTGPDSTTAVLTVRWPLGLADPVASVRGTVGGAPLAGHEPAP